MDKTKRTRRASGSERFSFSLTSSETSSPGEEERTLANYKTEICRSHFSTCSCDYGAACQFAHGVDELRAKQFDFKYKTELCKRFHSLGPESCKFGSRCKFLHQEYRIKAGENEYWLVSPEESQIRVEIVHSGNKQRLEQLNQLVFQPPRGPVSPLPQENQTDKSQEESPEGMKSKQIVNTNNITGNTKEVQNDEKQLKSHYSPE
jgi:butyrate response factor 1